MGVFKRFKITSFVFREELVGSIFKTMYSVGQETAGLQLLLYTEEW